MFLCLKLCVILPKNLKEPLKKELNRGEVDEKVSMAESDLYAADILLHGKADG